MMRSSVFRLSPLLLLAAALVALAVSFVLGSPPVAAQDPTPIPPSTNANLSGLTASYANGNSSTFTTMSLTPVFDSGTTNYYPDTGRSEWARHVPIYVTHVKVTPTVADMGKATVQVGRGGRMTTLATVTSGATSEAIPLAVPYTHIIVRVTAEDGKTTRDYNVRVSRNGSFTSIFGVQAGDGALHLSWNPPAFDRDEVRGYDVHYTSSTTVAGDAEVGSDAATEWVDAGHSGDVWQTNYSITGLANDTTYRVRVRSVSNAGDGSDDVGGVLGVRLRHAVNCSLRRHSDRPVGRQQREQRRPVHLPDPVPGLQLQHHRLHGIGGELQDARKAGSPGGPTQRSRGGGQEPRGRVGIFAHRRITHQLDYPPGHGGQRHHRARAGQ